MTDKQWLDRVVVALEVYEKSITDDEKQKIDHFVEWLHQQYGIVYRSPIKIDN